MQTSSDRNGGHLRSGALSAGPWPFITWRTFFAGRKRLIWRARDHRKGLMPVDRGIGDVAPPLWRSSSYNWTIGLLFAAGSALFMLGSALMLFPAGAAPVSLVATNIIFFLGSVPFTIAAFLQHFQSANAACDDEPLNEHPVRMRLIGWQPRSVGWLSTLAQSGGTIAFNFNTGDAIHPPSGWLMQDVAVWAPGFIGSALFLVSGYLAFIEYGHRYWSWKPRALGWRLVFVNLAGCVFFMMSSTLAWIPAGPEPGWIPWSASFCLLLGSFGFLVGAILTMREARSASI